MGDPETKAKRSASRKRNVIAKQMWEAKGRTKKVHASVKDREKQKRWRLENDPDNDYEELDDFLMRGYSGS